MNVLGTVRLLEAAREHGALRRRVHVAPPRQGLRARQERHREAGVGAIVLSMLANGEAPHVFGDGTQERDYVFVADAVTATLAALERPAGMFNVGTGTAEPQ